MGVKKYEKSGVTLWRIDSWLIRPDGTLYRFRQSRIPTREQALVLEAKKRAECFEGRFFDRRKEERHTVAELWRRYEPITTRDNRSFLSDYDRAEHLCRHLGSRVAARLMQRDIDEYRNLRLAENTRRGAPPAPASLDRELALLKRVLNYAVDCGDLDKNPIARVSLLNEPNVRRIVLDEPTFGRVLAGADPEYQPILLVAYDTGMRLGEIRLLRWEQVDLKEGCVRLSHEDTKTGVARRVYLTDRVVEALKAVPRHPDSPYVFTSKRSGTAFAEFRHMFERACRRAGIHGVWFHDLRRSFVTNARKRGVAESVVMRMSGHKTRSVFDRYNVVDDADVRVAVARIEDGRRKEMELADRDDAGRRTRFGQMEVRRWA